MKISAWLGDGAYIIKLPCITINQMCVSRLQWAISVVQLNKNANIFLSW